MSIASLEGLILDALADAPPGSNPFRIIETALLFSQEGTYPPSYKYQLWVLSGALALIVVLIAVGAGIDALRGRLWVVTIRSGYILPHWKFSWSAYAIILFSLLQGLIWRTLQALEGARSWDLTLWKTVVWTPACLCGLTSIWVLGVNYILLVKSTGIEITSIFARPAVVNSVALLLPIFYIGSVVGSCTAVAVSYDKVLDILDEVYAELDAAAAAWEGAPLSLAAMGPELVALARIQAPDALFMWRMRWIFGVTFAWGVIIFFAMSWVAYLQLGVFQKVIGNWTGTLHTSSGNNNLMERGKEGGVLQWSLRSLIVTVTCFLLIGLAISSLCLWVTVTAPTTLFSPRGLEVSTLGSIYVFVAFSLPTSIVLLYRAIHMDGTLVDSIEAEEYTMGAWPQTQGMLPQEFFDQSHTIDSIKRFQTVPVPGSSLSKAELALEVVRIEALTIHNGAVLAAAGGHGIYALPGVHTLLDALRAGGARFGVVTSGTTPYADSALMTAEIHSLPFRVCGDQCINGKPHPEPFLKGLEALKALPGPPITASRVLVFEDAPNGLTSGLAAGCKTLAVCTSHSHERILKTEATYRVIDLTRVEVIGIDKVKGEITLRLTTLEEETG